MPFRKILFWSHLVAGIATGLVILMLAVTGALLTYEVQIIHWAENRLDVTVPESPPLPADDLAEIALVETGGKATALVYENDPAAPVKATSGRDGKLFLDPYTGAVLGEGSSGLEGFFGTVTSLHRWLSLSGPNETGAAITGAANLVFGFLLLSGSYLWLPKLWKWGMLKMRILFRRSYPNSRARDFAWHHVFAFWAAVPLFLIILSGVVISYNWAGQMLFTAYGEEMRRSGGPGGGFGGGLGRGRGQREGAHDEHGTGLAIVDDGVGLQAIVDAAGRYDPDWNWLTLTLPNEAGTNDVTVRVDTGTGKQIAKQETLTISQISGEVTAVSRFADRSPATQARMWLRFVHTGEYYGVIGQTIAGLASLAGAVMVYTGLALSYRRLVQPLFRRRKMA